MRPAPLQQTGSLERRVTSARYLSAGLVADFLPKHSVNLRGCRTGTKAGNKRVHVAQEGARSMAELRDLLTCAEEIPREEYLDDQDVVEDIHRRVRFRY